MIHGFINLHKPLTWTSHDCVARLRRLLNTKKVGHGGTLDPLATGVLPVAVGRATRLLQYLPEGKAYQALVRFGVTTTTDDLEGEIIQQKAAVQLQRSHLEAVLSEFVGEVEQVPPAYSAIQVEGKRLYDLARQGKAVEVPKRQVRIDQLCCLNWQAGDRPEMTLKVRCGPGTYIRSLARDLGEKVGTGATLAGLVRTHSSGFDIAESVTLEGLEAALAQGTFVPVAAGEAVRHLAAIALPPPLARRWCLGQKLALADVMPYLPPERYQNLMTLPVRVMHGVTQTFLGIGEFRAGIPTLASDRASDPMNDPANALPVSQGTVFAPKRVFVTDMPDA